MISILRNFCDHYDELIVEAESAHYAPYEAAGVVYPNIHITNAQWAYDKIGWYGDYGPVERVLDGFRRYHAGVTDPMHWIHSDASVSEWSAILSCSRPGHFNGSLCFWSHRATGWRQPDISYPAGVVQTSEDTNDVDAWDREVTIRLRPNTMVIYPAALYHSRWPRYWHLTDHPRTVQVFFFNSK